MTTVQRPAAADLPAPAPSAVTPQTLASFREELKHRDHDVVDGSWAGSVPGQYGVAPRVRIGRDRWFNLRPRSTRTSTRATSPATACRCPA